jgi:exosortase
MPELFGNLGVSSFYSRGLLVPLFAACLVWRVRHALVGLRPAWSSAGALLVASGVACVGLGATTRSVTVAALGVPLLVGGLAVLLMGREQARTLAFPIAFLWLMTPLPRTAIPSISLVLQHAAALATEAGLNVLGVDNRREGTRILLHGVTVDINETCNGLAFLMAMPVIGVAFAWLSDRTLKRGSAVVGMALGVGLVGNWVRITGTALIAYWWGASAASGRSHDVYGELVYMAMVGVFVVLAIAVNRRWSDADRVPESAPSAVA